MALDLSAKKSDYSSAAISFAERLLDLTREGEELAAYQSANGFQSGGAAALVDNDMTGTNAYITAADINSVVTIAGQLGTSVTTAMRNTMRKVSRKPSA